MPRRRVGSEGIAPPLLISALDGGERSASRPGSFTPEERAPRRPLDKRLGGPQSRSERYGEKKILPLPGIELRPSSPYPVFRPAPNNSIQLFIINVPCQQLNANYRHSTVYILVIQYS
jgi:hypothetical protein